QLIENRFLPEIALHELDAGQLFHWQQITRDDAPLATHLPCSVLAPGARGRPQIETHLSRLQQLLATVDLLQLEYGPGAPTFPLCPLHERIGEMLLEPATTALRTPAH